MAVRKSLAGTPAKGTQFTLNEPVEKIPGGATRRSSHVERTGFENVARRLRLNRLLLSHDPAEVDEAVSQIEPADLPVLRIMAQESVISGNEPAVRRRAIYMLGRFPTVENLNLLIELAETREDLYVRISARSALADTGLVAAAPWVKDGLLAKDPLERRGAELAVERLIGKLGVERSRSVLLSGERRAAVMSGVNAALEKIEGHVERPVRKRATSREDPPTHADAPRR